MVGLFLLGEVLACWATQSNYYFNCFNKATTVRMSNSDVE